MIQRFIELGEGYSDLYELLELADSNSNRLEKLVALKTIINDKEVCSFAVVLRAAGESNFQPIYMCREGIPVQSKRWTLFQQLADRQNKKIHLLEVRPSSGFNEKDLYYQYLTGVLRMQHIIPAWQ
jgi:hypothetical protein